jgi:hypothetical protein
VREIPVSAFQFNTVPVVICKELLTRTGFVTVPATAGAVNVAVPEVFPDKPRIPEPPPAIPMVNCFAPSVVRKVAVAGAAPEPPPRTGECCANRAEDAHVVKPEKYGMPPEVPATVKAGVVVGVATEINPPVKETLVTVPEPELAATHFTPVTVDDKT